MFETNFPSHLSHRTLIAIRVRVNPDSFEELIDPDHLVFKPPAMATTLDSVVKLNSDRKAQRSARVRSVEKEFLQLLRSAPKHFQSKTPLSAKQLLNRWRHPYHMRLTVVSHGYIIIYHLHQRHLWNDYDRFCKISEGNMRLDSEYE